MPPESRADGARRTRVRGCRRRSGTPISACAANPSRGSGEPSGPCHPHHPPPAGRCGSGRRAASKGGAGPAARAGLGAPKMRRRPRAGRLGESPGRSRAGGAPEERGRSRPERYGDGSLLGSTIRGTSDAAAPLEPDNMDSPDMTPLTRSRRVRRLYHIRRPGGPATATGSGSEKRRPTRRGRSGLHATRGTAPRESVIECTVRSDRDPGGGAAPVRRRRPPGRRRKPAGTKRRQRQYRE